MEKQFVLEDVIKQLHLGDDLKENILSCWGDDKSNTVENQIRLGAIQSTIATSRQMPGYGEDMSQLHTLEKLLKNFKDSKELSLKFVVNKFLNLETELCFSAIQALVYVRDPKYLYYSIEGMIVLLKAVIKFNGPESVAIRMQNDMLLLESNHDKLLDIINKFIGKRGHHFFKTLLKFNKGKLPEVLNIKKEKNENKIHNLKLEEHMQVYKVLRQFSEFNDISEFMLYSQVTKLLEELCSKEYVKPEDDPDFKWGLWCGNAVYKETVVNEK